MTPPRITVRRDGETPRTYQTRWDNRARRFTTQPPAPPISWRELGGIIAGAVLFLACVCIGAAGPFATLGG